MKEYTNYENCMENLKIFFSSPWSWTSDSDTNCAKLLTGVRHI